MIDLSHQQRRLVFELRPLYLKILFRIFAGPVLKVQVAEVLVELFLALQQIVQPGLLALAGKKVYTRSARVRNAPANSPCKVVISQNPPSMPVSRRILSRRSRSAGSSVAGSGAVAWVFPIDRFAHRRTSKMVPSSAAANTAKGAIQATRSKPCVVGAASTVAPYLAANEARISLSLLPAAMAALNSLRIRPDSGQPTWLHSPSSCAQPQVHISRCPRSLKRELASVAPIEKQTATASTPACTALIQKVRDRKVIISCRPSALALRESCVPARTEQLLPGSGWEPAPPACRRPALPVPPRSNPPEDSETP